MRKRNSGMRVTAIFLMILFMGGILSNIPAYLIFREKPHLGLGLAVGGVILSSLAGLVYLILRFKWREWLAQRGRRKKKLNRLAVAGLALAAVGLVGGLLLDTFPHPHWLFLPFSHPHLQFSPIMAASLAMILASLVDVKVNKRGKTLGFGTMLVVCAIIAFLTFTAAAIPATTVMVVALATTYRYWKTDSLVK